MDSFGENAGDNGSEGYPSPGDAVDSNTLPSDECPVERGVSTVIAPWKLLGLSDSLPWRDSSFCNCQ